MPSVKEFSDHVLLALYDKALPEDAGPHVHTYGKLELRAEILRRMGKPEAEVEREVIDFLRHKHDRPPNGDDY